MWVFVQPLGMCNSPWKPQLSFMISQGSGGWWNRGDSLSLLHNVWGFPWLDPWLQTGPLGLPSILLYANSGSLRRLCKLRISPASPPRVALAWEFQNSQTSCMMAHGSSSSLPKARAETARLLRTWPHVPQNMILSVMKVLRPAQTEGKGALSLPLSGKSSRDCVTMFNSTKGRADLQEHC